MTPQPPKAGSPAAAKAKPADEQAQAPQPTEQPQVDWTSLQESMAAIRANQEEQKERDQKVIARLDQLENQVTEPPKPVAQTTPATESQVQVEQAAEKAAAQAIDKKADEAAKEVKGLPAKMVGGLWNGVKWTLEPLKPRVPTKEGVRNAVVLEVATLGVARYVPPVRYAVINIITP